MTENKKALTIVFDSELVASKAKRNQVSSMPCQNLTERAWSALKKISCTPLCFKRKLKNLTATLISVGYLLATLPVRAEFPPSNVIIEVYRGIVQVIAVLLFAPDYFINVSSTKLGG